MWWTVALVSIFHCIACLITTSPQQNIIDDSRLDENVFGDAMSETGRHGRSRQCMIQCSPHSNKAW